MPSSGIRPTTRRGIFSVRNKIVGAVLLASAAACIAGIAGIWQITSVAARGRAIYTQTVLPNQEVGRLRDVVGRARIDGLSRANAKTAEAKNQYNESLKADEVAIDQITTAYGRRNLTRGQRQALEAFVTNWNGYRDLRVQADQLAAQGRMSEFEALRAQRMTPTVNAALTALDRLSKEAETVAVTRVEAADAARTHALWIIAAVIVAGTLGSLLIGLAVARTVVRPLRRLREILNAVADGDLSQHAAAAGQLRHRRAAVFAVAFGRRHRR